MRTTIIAAALILSFCFAFADETCRTSLYPSPAKAELSALQLSDTQKEKVRTLQQTYRDETKPIQTAMRAALRQYSHARSSGDLAAAEAYRPTIDSYHAELKQRRAAFDEKVIDVLTPEQRVRWQALRANSH